MDMDDPSRWLQCFDDKAGGWGRLEDMAMGRPCGCGVAALGTYLYAFGGEGDDVEESACMTVYNMATRKMEEVAKLPRALQLCTGVACCGLVYSLGGYDGALEEVAASVHAYNPDIDSWVGGPPLPVAVADMAAAEHMGCIYVCGGALEAHVRRSIIFGRESPSGSLLMLDPRTRAWATLPAMPTPVAPASAALVAGRMYVPGGDSGAVLPGNLSLPILQCYDMAAGRWDTSCVPMAQARTDHGVAALHGEVWAVGGTLWGEYVDDGQTGRETAEVEVYSPGLNTWRSGVSLPQAWSGGACALVQC